jgi:hypothetical protein
MFEKRKELDCLKNRIVRINLRQNGNKRIINSCGKLFKTERPGAKRYKNSEYGLFGKAKAGNHSS